MQWTPAARAELSIQEQGIAVQRAGASERRERSEHMDRTASTRAYERHPCAARLCCLAVPEFVIRPHVHGA
jgi:hypothetical protein